MEITLELSYYPLKNEFEEIVSEFIKKLSADSRIRVDVGVMSSLITGEYYATMAVLTETMQPFLEKYPSVFNISIANACSNCKRPE